MARTTGTASLADLIENEVLMVGEEMELHRRSAATITGILQKDGTIKVGTTTYQSPSEAAREELETGTANGWARWRVPRLNGKNLNEIRGE